MKPPFFKSVMGGILATLLTICHSPGMEGTGLSLKADEPITTVIIYDQEVNITETSLNLRNLRLSTLPKEIGALTNLTELNLCHNYLSTLPEGIGNIINLKTLWL